jgi:hypothetical protein
MRHGPTTFARTAAIGVFVALSVVAAYQASVVIDGTRYFWLDDDQMISMRYGRNLVQGHGLVWNPGERVEGYTNPVWTLVMAAVHLLPVSDARTSAVVHVINALLGITVLLLSERLLRTLGVDCPPAVLLLLLTLAPCSDLVFWSSHGFEVTLLTALALLVTVRFLDDERLGRERWWTFLLLGMIPLVRSDAFHVWLPLAILALGLSRRRRTTAGWLLLSLAPAAAHADLRLVYYGDWLPNTYYLKVQGNEGLALLGGKYLARFLRHYGAVITVAVAGAYLTGDRRRWFLLSGVAISGLYVVAVGGDTFRYSRFFAHLVPVLLVLGMAAAPALAQTERRLSLLVGLAVASSVYAQVGVFNPEALRNPNGEPEGAVVAGVLIRDHTESTATVAGFAAGCVPYFSHRPAVDLLGKTSREIARGRPQPGRPIGHNKFDHERSLGMRPDFVVSLTSHEAVMAAAQGKDAAGYWAALAHTATFRDEYLPFPVPVEFLMDTCAVYVRGGSPEKDRIASWREPRLGR